ncbi:hypothetical protein Tco_0616236 [Tanacetum coccineum]
MSRSTISYESLAESLAKKSEPFKGHELLVASDPNSVEPSFDLEPFLDHASPAVFAALDPDDEPIEDGSIDVASSTNEPSIPPLPTFYPQTSHILVAPVILLGHEPPVRPPPKRCRVSPDPASSLAASTPILPIIPVEMLPSCERFTTSERVETLEREVVSLTTRLAVAEIQIDALQKDVIGRDVRETGIIARHVTRQGMTPNAIEELEGQYDGGSGSRRIVHTARGCTYKKFLNYQPLNFKGTEGAIGLAWWFKKIESVFNISNCAVECQVNDDEVDDCSLLSGKKDSKARGMVHEEEYKVERRVGHIARDWHYRSDCPKLKSQNLGNTTKNAAGSKVLSTAFSSLLDITPYALDTKYDVELADGKLIRVDTIIRGCTLNLLNNPFNIDLMPIVRIPYSDEILIVQGDRSDGRSESRLNIISSTKTQKYLQKGCHVFLAHITEKKPKDKSEEKRLKDVLTVRDFPKVFSKDFSGLPPTRQVEFQIDLVPGVHGRLID